MSAYFKTYIYFVILIENHDVSSSTRSFFFPFSVLYRKFSIYYEKYVPGISFGDAILIQGYSMSVVISFLNVLDYKI